MKQVLLIRSVTFTALMIGLATLLLVTAQPAGAAGIDTSPVAAAGDQQTIPEPPAPEGPGEVPGGDAVPGQGVVPEGESAMADGGAATPWVLLGIGVLLVLALVGAVWASRKPRVSDDIEVRDRSVTEHRYIPPGV